MNETFRLGRVAGVTVGVNWTVLIVLGLIALGLAGGRLPLVAPGWPTVVYLLVGALSALVFLACLLAHEVAHAVVARREGVAVEGITLWLFGGVARLRGEPATPGADLRIAGVGPLVSLMLGGLFLALAAGLTAVGGAALPAAVLGWLGVINLVLAVFNLVPAAPLDGGRVLRAAVWRATGDRRRAVVVAARAGRVFGVVLIAAGLAQVVLLPGFAGLWLALVGWFLVAAARAEEDAGDRHPALAGIRVADVMTPDPESVAPALTVEEFLDRRAASHPAFPVVDHDGAFVGLVTRERAAAVPPERRPATRVGDIACPPTQVPVAAHDEEFAALLPRMHGCGDGRALVLDPWRRVRGVVSPSDVARAVQAAERRRGAGSRA